MPRGRPRKPRLSRMDAAVDAMRPLGFPEEKVIRHVKELLKEYGGDEGWPFIEDCAYKELIDALLRAAEKDDLMLVAQDGNQMKDKLCSGEEPAETSSRASDTQQVEIPQENAPSDIVAVAETTSEVDCNTPVISKAETDGKGWNDIIPDQTCGNIEETAILVREEEPTPMAKVDSPTISQIPASPIPSLPPPTNCRRRLPCYGWFDSDDDNDDDFICLKPLPGVLGAKATPSRDVSKRLSDLKGKRKTRWDEKPDSL